MVWWNEIGIVMKIILKWNWNRNWNDILLFGWLRRMEWNKYCIGWNTLKYFSRTKNKNYVLKMLTKKIEWWLLCSFGWNSYFTKWWIYDSNEITTPMSKCQNKQWNENYHSIPGLIPKTHALREKRIWETYLMTLLQ